MGRPDVFTEHFDLTQQPEYEVALAHSLVFAGATFNIGTRVIKWNEPEGFDGYDTTRVEHREMDRRTGRMRTKVIKGKRYNSRKHGLEGISQIMIHHTGGDGNGAGNVFNTLHNARGLSVHFVVDDDGMIWQFLDCQERAWHGGLHNDISVGIECNLYPLADERPNYYSPERCRRLNNLSHEVREEVIHGRKLRTFQFTDPQVAALCKLCAGIWIATAVMARGAKVDNNVKRYLALGKSPMFPRVMSGDKIPRTKINQPKRHIGLIGHLQCTRNKIDPAGFPWEQFEAQCGRTTERFAGMVADEIHRQGLEG
jgi:hypothetical protein